MYLITKHVIENFGGNCPVAPWSMACSGDIKVAHSLPKSTVFSIWQILYFLVKTFEFFSKAYGAVGAPQQAILVVIVIRKKRLQLQQTESNLFTV